MSTSIFVSWLWMCLTCQHIHSHNTKKYPLKFLKFFYTYICVFIAWQLQKDYVQYFSFLNFMATYLPNYSRLFLTFIRATVRLQKTFTIFGSLREVLKRVSQYRPLFESHTYAIRAQKCKIEGEFNVYMSSLHNNQSIRTNNNPLWQERNGLWHTTCMTEMNTWIRDK